MARAEEPTDQPSYLLKSENAISLGDFSERSTPVQALTVIKPFITFPAHGDACCNTTCLPPSPQK